MANGRTIGDETWEELWIYDVQTSEPRRLYITPDHPIGAFNNRGIGESWWSPDSNYLLFVEWYSITGGSINDLNLLDVHSGKVLSLYGQYYASYYPVWSPDSKWILMPLQKVYLPHPELDRVDKEEQGDLYLYRAKDAQQFQLTSSPQTAEFNHRWSADGKTILFEQYDYSKRNPVIEAAQIELADVLEGSPVIKLKPFKKSPSPYQPNLGEYNYYSPDGLHMAYLNHYKDQTYHLFVADGNGSNWYFTGAKLKKPNYDFLGWRPGGATN
jgi:Tol biopolymer transport system component